MRATLIDRLKRGPVEAAGLERELAQLERSGVARREGRRYVLTETARLILFDPVDA